MPNLETVRPQGQLSSSWSALVEDYAIAGAWTCDGKVFVVGDAAGGAFGFQSGSGKQIWVHREVHKGGLLSISPHPNDEIVTTAGQDGRILFWNATSGELKQTIELGQNWIENLSWSPDGQWLAASCSRRI